MAIEEKQAHTLGMICHLLGLFTSFMGPLVVWLLKKDDHPFIDQCGKEALNFQISVGIYYVGAMILSVVLIGALLLPVIFIGAFVLTIIAAVKTSKGETYKYPLTIRLIK